jgi:hypothetical protein
MLHELLHSFGLGHSNDTYSFMNYSAFPWAGGGVAETDAIRPLPDDAEALRDQYGDTSDRYEVALLTTWVSKDPVYDMSGSAFLGSLCVPSLGDTAADPLAFFCGTGGPKSGSTVVCAGDKLHTQVAFANYSTETADDINMRMYLSTDDVFDSTDVLSPTGINVTVDRGRSKLVGKAWEVPSGLTSGVKYYVILHAIGTTVSGEWVEDWTPLRAQVEAC